MVLKYARHVGEPLSAYEEVYRMGHAPIDRRFLEALRELQRPKFPNPGCPWSKITDYDGQYQPLQIWIRNTFSDFPLSAEYRFWNKKESLRPLIRAA